jgi:hypothetical protein
LLSNSDILQKIRQNLPLDALVLVRDKWRGNASNRTVQPLALLEELGGSEAEILAELAAKVGRLAKTELQGDFLDGFCFPQENIGRDHPLFIKPLLGRATEGGLRVPLKLPQGDATVRSHIRRVKLGLPAQP